MPTCKVMATALSVCCELLRPHQRAVTGRKNVTVASGDFNGDGNADFAVGNYDGDSTGVTIFLSRGDGSLQHGVNYGSGGGMFKVAVADFDGDGKLDVAARITTTTEWFRSITAWAMAPLPLAASYSTLVKANAYPHGASWPAILTTTSIPTSLW